MRSRHLFPALLLLGAGVAAAQPAAKITPASCEEGRPVTLTLEAQLPEDQHIALLRLEGRAGSESTQHGFGRRRSALPLFPNLGPGVLTLELIASEDLSHSAVARLPRPDVRAELDGQPFSLCRLAKPGEVLRLQVSLIPRVDQTQVSVSWKAFVLSPLGDGVFVREKTQRWRPGADAPAPHLGGPPRLPGPTAEPGGPSVTVELVHWKPWKGADADEVLIEETQTKSLQLVEATAKANLAVVPAAFGLGAAAARAKAEPLLAIRLADDRWVLQRPGQWWVVPPSGDVARGKGEAFPLAIDLARTGRSGFLWYDHGSRPTLTAALQEAGFGKSAGKALPIEVEAAQLVEFLRLLEAHGCTLSRNGIAPLD